MTTGAAQVMTSVELEVEATSGKDVGEITNETLESVHAGACAAPSGLGADLERRKRGIELLSELLRRRAREKLSCVREDQRIWRDDLKKRSRQRQRLAKKERMAQQQLKLGNPPGYGVELGGRIGLGTEKSAGLCKKRFSRRRARSGGSMSKISAGKCC